MSFTFEFDCPSTYQFINNTPKEPYDYTIDPSDSNDAWFLIQHHDTKFKLNTQPQTDQENQEKPIRRSKINDEDKPIVVSDKESKERGKKKRSKQTQKQRIPPIIKDPKKAVHFRRILVTQPRQPNQKTHPQGILKSNPKHKIQDKVAMTRSKSSQSRLDVTQDYRPCPYPPRLQRQWQANNSQKWYNLSPGSKKKAEKSMENMQNSQKMDISKKSKSKQSRRHKSLGKSR